jgi:DNA-binding transcriptional MocR family regulator
MTEYNQFSVSDTIHADLYFAIIPEWVLNLPVSANAIRTYCCLRRYADNQTGECFPSRKTVAMRARLSVSTLDRAIKELVEYGAIEITPRKNAAGDWSSNLYTVRSVPKGRHLSSPAKTPPVAGGDTRAFTGGEGTRAIRTKSNNTVPQTYEEKEYLKGVDFGFIMRRQQHDREQMLSALVGRSQQFSEGAKAGYDGVTPIAPEPVPASPPQRRS